MNTLRKELRPDFATAEKLYPLVLKRLRDYEAFHDAQSEDTPEEVFDKEYKAMEQYLSKLTGKDLSDIAAFVRIVIDNEFECENDFQREFMPYIFYSDGYFFEFLEINCPRFDPSAFNTIKDKNGKYHEPTVEEVMNKIWK